MQDRDELAWQLIESLSPQEDCYPTRVLWPLGTVGDDGNAFLRRQPTANMADHVITNEVVVAICLRQSRAIALGDDDQMLWYALARAADLHRPMCDKWLGQLRCAECTSGDTARVWPCQTLRLMAIGLGLDEAAPGGNKKFR